MKKLLLFLVALTLCLTFFGSAKAADFRSDENSLNINSTDTLKNAYLASGNITVESKTQGDLAIAGGTVIVNGDIEKSLFIGAGTVAIRGNVGDHARIAGGTITLSGNVGGDLFIAGGTVTINPTVTVKGDLVISGGTVLIEGNILGKMRISGGSVELRGQSGETKVWSSKLIVGPKAVINGNLYYKSKNQAQIDSAAKISGKVDFDQIHSNLAVWFAGMLNLAFLLQILGAMIVAWLMVHFFPKTLNKLVNSTISKPMNALGTGLLLAFVIPIGLLILLFTVIGIQLAFMVGTIWVTAMIVGGIIGRVIFGSIIIKALTRESDYKADAQAAVVGVLVLGVISLLPFVGALAGFIVFLLGVGAMFNLLKSLNDSKLAS